MAANANEEINRLQALYLKEQQELQRNGDRAGGSGGGADLGGVLGGVEGPDLGGVLGGEQFDQFAVFKQQMAVMKQQLVAQKVMQRESKINSEKAKHSEPQIKRALEKLFTFSHDVEDCKEELDSLNEVPFTVENKQTFFSGFNTISGILDSLQSKISTEIEMSKIASTSQYKWMTVKQLETDAIFKGDNAEEMTKKMRSAEFQAAKVLRSMRGVGRGGRARFNGRARWSDPSPRPPVDSNLAQLMSLAQTLAPAPNRGGFKPTFFSGSCYNCDKPGHIAAQCTLPKKKPAN